MRKPQEQKIENKIQKDRKKYQAQTQWHLIWRSFKKHKLALIGLIFLFFIYMVGVIIPGFFAPYTQSDRIAAGNLPPTKLNFFDKEGNFHLRPFIYNWEIGIDPSSWERLIKPNTEEKYPVHFFVKGKEYKVLGLFKTAYHFFGVGKGGKIFLLGTGGLGRDIFSRTIYACRISLTIGFVGMAISLFLGLIIGGISGLSGGVIDDFIQRLIEILMSIPKIPLWMALAAAVPNEWSMLKIYFAITVILSLMGWTGLARVVRSKFISLREEDFVMAAKSYNASSMLIITRHLIPNFISYIIVNITLAIPGMILGETALSFLGIGLRPPIVSLGVLLNRAQSFQTVSMYPWILYPGLVVVIVVLAFNFVGDGLRDAADPYESYS